MPKAVAFTTEEGGTWTRLPSSVYIPSINFTWEEHSDDYFSLLFDDFSIRDRYGSRIIAEETYKNIVSFLKERG